MRVFKKLEELLARVLQMEGRMEEVDAVAREGKFDDFAEVLSLGWVSDFFFVDVAEERFWEGGVEVLEGGEFVSD